MPRCSYSYFFVQLKTDSAVILTVVNLIIEFIEIYLKVIVKVNVVCSIAVYLYSLFFVCILTRPEAGSS